jgi:hypothetical protein
MAVNLQLWKNLYTLFDEITELKPWDFLYETDIFGIKSPDTGQQYFISIMGTRGEVFGLAVYEGPLALHRFWDFYDYEAELGSDSLLLIPHTLVIRDDRENLSNQQYNIIKKLGLKYRGRGAWPNIQKITPGFLPHNPDEKRLNDLIHILSQSINVITRARENKAFIHPIEHHDDEYLIREQSQKGKNKEWTDASRRVPTPGIRQEFYYNTAHLDAFKSLSFQYEHLETDLKLVPAPTKEKNLSPCFPFLLLFVEPTYGTILDFELILPSPDFTSMISRLPDLIFQKITKNNSKPRKLKFKSPYIEGVMRLIQNETNVVTEHAFHLPALDEAAQTMIEHLQNYGR